MSNRVFRNRQRIAEAEKTTELTEQEAALKALQRDSGVMRRASKPVSKAIDRVGDRIDRLRGRAGRREKFDIREATEQLELDRKDLAERAYAGEFAEEVESAKDLAKGIDIEKNLLPTAKLMKKASEEPPLITSQRARVEREVAEQDRLMSPHRLALPESLEEVVVPQTEEVADEISDALRDNLTTDYALQPDTPFTLNGVNINLNDPLATSPFLVSPEALVKTTQIQPDFSLSSKTLTPAEEKAYKGIMSPSPNGGAYTLTFHGGDISNKTRIQPRVWQHKESDPITGVVKKGGIKTTKKFNSNAADVAMGYLWKNGRLDIVDGHQRRNQFIKFVEEGQKGVFLRVEVFREADGITPETMRNLAAEKNTIQERGTVMDMARYIRSRPVGQRQAIFESMPTEMEGKSGRARGLASLEDEPFNWVARGDYPHEARAAMVGLKVIGEPEQMEAMKQLLRWKYPLGSVEAIGDAIDTIVLSFEGRRVEQGTMFASVGVDSLIQEMSFVITKFKKMARGDKKLMRLVADNAESIEERAVASKIDIDKSRYVSHEQETVEFLITKLSRRSGSVSRLIRAVAKQVKERGQSAADINAYRRFSEAITSGGIAEAELGTARRGVGAETQPESPARADGGQPATPRAVEVELEGATPKQKERMGEAVENTDDEFDQMRGQGKIDEEDVSEVVEAHKKREVADELLNCVEGGGDG